MSRDDPQLAHRIATDRQEVGQPLLVVSPGLPAEGLHAEGRLIIAPFVGVVTTIPITVGTKRTPTNRGTVHSTKVAPTTLRSVLVKPERAFTVRGKARVKPLQGTPNPSRYGGNGEARKQSIRPSPS